MGRRITGYVAWVATLLVAAAAFAGPARTATLKPGGTSEFEVELPSELRRIAGRGELSAVTHARVSIAVPEAFESARDWPVIVISATSDPNYNSSRALLDAYAETALGAGWIAVAADPVEPVTADHDDVTLRFALDLAALAVLKRQWPGAGAAPLAFGGFSGGAKYSGWLAAAFASQGRRIIGLYLAGVNEENVARAARELDVMSEAYRRIPVFLQSGEADETATLGDHRRVYDELKHAGFRNVRIEHFPGAHEVYPPPLRTALDWFRQLARDAPAAR